jgi:uncharacterized protein (DUF302 family)
VKVKILVTGLIGLCFIANSHRSAAESVFNAHPSPLPSGLTNPTTGIQNSVAATAKNNDTGKTVSFGRQKTIRLIFHTSFDDYTKNLEKLLGRFDSNIIKDYADDPAGLQKKLEENEGEQNLMLFRIEDHGTFLILYGKAVKATRYFIGNPLIATSMAHYDIRSALYVPMRVLIYEDNKQVLHVEYDLPSSELGQLHNIHITNIAKDLDRKIYTVLMKADHPPK